MNTTTPEKIPGQVKGICDDIAPGIEPVFVPVQTRANCEPGECFFNVQAMVAMDGGRIIYGWTIWIWPGVLIEAEHHAVWELPDGTVVDVTPKDHREQRILFLRDDNATFDYEGIRQRDNVRLALSSRPEVQEYIDAAAELTTFIETHSLGREVTFEKNELLPLVTRVQRAQHAIYDLFLRQSDMCTCGSQRQVRKCCGLKRARRPYPRPYKSNK